MKGLLLALLLLLGANAFGYTRQDSLRGGNGRGRDWWDVLKYDLMINIDTATKSVSGTCSIRMRIKEPQRDSIQLDLQAPLEIDEVTFNDGVNHQDQGPLKIEREGNVYWVNTRRMGLRAGDIITVTASYHGAPRLAVNPPWDGGFIWTKDSMGKPWISVACQGLGASSWWPCKDYQGDEPDNGMTISFQPFEFAPEVNGFSGTGMICNGKFYDRDTVLAEDPVSGTTQKMIGWDVNYWKVRNPINTYSTTFYIGDYAHWHDTLHGEKGVLDLDFYPLRNNEAKARRQWTQAKEMLRCFEWWMGPYPFYEDGYKLVEAPYLGMEHQSAIAYGNHYTNGYYRSTGAIDRSGTGVGFSFDFIIIHESGHEWFGNNITARDIADNWLHEGFTTYTETLFAEWVKGKDSAFAYVTGQQKNIRNDRPVIGDYGVNDDGSSDKYDKGAQVVHMIRLMMNNDSAFRQLLRGLNRDFYHKIVTTKEVEDYISKAVGKDLKPFFDQYLRTTNKPILEWSADEGVIRYHWRNAVPGFCAPVQAQLRTRHAYMTTSKYGYFNYSGVDPKDVSVLPVGWYDVVERR